MDLVRIYDNKGKTFDRFTAVYMNEPERCGGYAAVGMSERPFHPQGYGMHCSAMPGKHLGRRIHFTDLPADCRQLISQDVKVGFLKVDQMESPVTADMVPSRMVTAYRIVDARGVDIQQPWCASISEVRKAAKETGIFLVEPKKPS